MSIPLRCIFVVSLFRLTNSIAALSKAQFQLFEEILESLTEFVRHSLDVYYLRVVCNRIHYVHIVARKQHRKYAEDYEERACRLVVGERGRGICRYHTALVEQLSELQKAEHTVSARDDVHPLVAAYHRVDECERER